MQWLWTWGGECFGYREDDELWTYDGRHVARFDGSVLYGSNGRYLGEVRENRLITKKSMKSHVYTSFHPLPRRVSYIRHVNYVPNVMIAGYEEFPPLHEA